MLLATRSQTLATALKFMGRRGFFDPSNPVDTYKRAKLAAQIADLEKSIAEKQLTILRLRKAENDITPSDYARETKAAQARITSAGDKYWK